MCIVLPRFDEAEDTVASVKFCEKTRHLLANFRHPEKARAGEIIQQVMQHNVSRFPRSEHSLLAAMSEHELIEKDYDDALIWYVAPHVLLKNGQGPTLHCVKLQIGCSLSCRGSDPRNPLTEKKKIAR